MVSSLASMNRQLGREIIMMLHQQTDTAHPPTDERLDALQKENAQLKEALEGRVLIERAKGMLMITQHCDEETAFQTLVTLSRQQRRKVRDIAADITASPPRWQPPTPRPTP